jgi:hypothetical protein
MISQKFMMDGHAPEHMNMRSERGAAIYSHADPVDVGTQSDPI